MPLADVFAPLVGAPEWSGILCDFDGTLSPVIDDPTAARALPGTTEVLGRLALRYARVAVISGRPASFLVDRFPVPITISGLYGLESVVDGEVWTRPEAEPWVPVLEQVAVEAEVTSPATIVERKRLSLTLHYRTDPTRADAVAAWARRAAERHGLEVRPARRSVELHPPLATDKGTVVEAVAAGLRAVVFLGDDVGDLAAFAALDRLAMAGVHAVRVVARSAESAPEVLAAADVLVDGPTGALALLHALAEAPSVDER